MIRTPLSLSLTEAQHDCLFRHLFPGDGKEALAFLLCGRRDGDRQLRLLAREVFCVPHDACNRSAHSISWQPESIVHLLECAERAGLSIVKVHSHPSGYERFSERDDESDNQILPMIKGWVGHPIPHASVVMLPCGRMFGRTLRSEQRELLPIDRVWVVGNDIRLWCAGKVGVLDQERNQSHKQAFGEATTAILQVMSIGVVGCSGTGGPVVEQLLRLGVRELVLVDPDVVEERNLNRIPHASADDARQKKFKVDVLADAIRRTGMDTSVISLSRNLWDLEVLRVLAQCDLVFGCVDSVDGRFLLNLLATDYLLPYFDIGVRLENHEQGRDTGTIREVCGTVHYLQPGLSSLLSRELFDMKDVASAGLRRRDPDAHQRQVRDKYIRGAHVLRPAVVSVNTFAASLAVNEMLARLHPYRETANAEHASVCFSLASMELLSDCEGMPCEILQDRVGHGDRLPFLGLPELSA